MSRLPLLFSQQRSSMRRRPDECLGNEPLDGSRGPKAPQQIYQEGLWICGRSAVPTGCASPASRASSESGEMLAFAHIPTGTTINKTIDVDEGKNRAIAPATALTMIGADIEIDRATP